MHQMATGQQLAHFDIPDMIDGTGIEFAQGSATSVDPERRQVVVGDVTLDYDYLIYAIGSRTDTSSVPGADTHAYTLDHPLALAERLAELPAGAAVTVCGNGLTGLEAATEIAESYPHLRVVLLGRDVPASAMGEKARAYVRRSLERLGIEVRWAGQLRCLRLDHRLFRIAIGRRLRSGRRLARAHYGRPGPALGHSPFGIRHRGCRRGAAILGRHPRHLPKRDADRCLRR
jgi:hypothetical protein